MTFFSLFFFLANLQKSKSTHFIFWIRLLCSKTPPKHHFFFHFRPFPIKKPTLGPFFALQTPQNRPKCAIFGPPSYEDSGGDRDSTNENEHSFGALVLITVYTLLVATVYVGVIS
jgi:hypothetical protein